MMRCDLEGKILGIDEKGIKRGDMTTTAVSFLAPLVVGKASTLNESPQSLKSLNNSSKVSVKFTGARELDSFDFDGAEKIYSQIRTNRSDVQSITKNTGLPEFKILRIKNHIFNEKHSLDDGLRLFDADPDIANAWKRLEKGEFLKEDLQLLEHEYFESRFERLFKTNYRKSHDAANRSGRKSGLE